MLFVCVFGSVCVCTFMCECDHAHGTAQVQSLVDIIESSRTSVGVSPWFYFVTVSVLCFHRLFQTR